MKKIVILSAILIYLLLSVGVSVSAHYCGDELQSISFFTFKTKSCCGDEEGTNTCCKDKVSYFSLHENQVENPVLKFEPLSTTSFLIPAIATIFYFQLDFNNNNNFEINHPIKPDIVVHEIPTYIRLHSLRV